MNRKWMVLLSLLIPCAAFSCDVTGILKQAYPYAKQNESGFELQGKEPQHIDIDAVACKVWPAYPELTLVAVPLTDVNSAEEGISYGDVELIVTDTATGKPLQRLREVNMAFEDAVRLDKVSFDTAHYDLSDKQRAFGLRLSKYNHSRASPLSEDSLWLYTLTDSGIRRVLAGLVVASSIGEWDDDCKGTFDNIKRTVAISSKDNGFRDLMVRERGQSSIETGKKNNDCVEKILNRPVITYQLHYDGKHYVMPKNIQALDTEDVTSTH
ncbi:PA3715 family protein [Glaciimonas soli]|uniref:Uncharacterized protein n=1 Tax=Glaciimonas soli TaxID=2590999 RepID=A0A843YVD9_9BURK|nr:hypothetical protein [Glaciimonas soli]MQR01653.1 hypothetical protein [Glaciimonas soli]